MHVLYSCVMANDVWSTEIQKCNRDQMGFNELFTRLMEKLDRRGLVGSVIITWNV